MCAFTPLRSWNKRRDRRRVGARNRDFRFSSLFPCETHRGYVSMYIYRWPCCHFSANTYCRSYQSKHVSPVHCINDPSSGLIASPVCKCQAPCKYKWHTCACCLKSSIMCKWTAEWWGAWKATSSPQELGLQTVTGCVSLCTSDPAPNSPPGCFICTSICLHSNTRDESAQPCVSSFFVWWDVNQSCRSSFNEFQFYDLK